MNKVAPYKIYGYAGLIPFIIFFIGIIIYKSDARFDHQASGMYFQMSVLLQLSYALLILNFMAGTHWLEAIRDNDFKRLSLSMLPTILSLILIVLMFLGVGYWLLLLMSAMFVGLYFMDRKYTNLGKKTAEYMSFRLRVTSLVSGILIASFGVSL